MYCFERKLQSFLCGALSFSGLVSSRPHWGWGVRGANSLLVQKVAIRRQHPAVEPPGCDPYAVVATHSIIPLDHGAQRDNTVSCDHSIRVAAARLNTRSTAKRCKPLFKNTIKTKVKHIATNSIVKDEAKNVLKIFNSLNERKEVATQGQAKRHELANALVATAP